MTFSENTYSESASVILLIPGGEGVEPIVAERHSRILSIFVATGIEIILPHLFSSRLVCCGLAWRDVVRRGMLSYNNN